MFEVLEQELRGESSTFSTLYIYLVQFVSPPSKQTALKHIICIKLSKQMYLWEMRCPVNLEHNVIELVGT